MKRLAAFVLTMSIAKTALATGPIGVGAPLEPPPPPVVGLEPGNRRAYWSNAPVGVFASSIVDAGYIYLRPQFAIGYGRPHWNFAQLETFATASAGTLGAYAGARVALPHFDARSGIRYQFPLARSFYAQQETYDRFSLESREGPSSRYSSWDSEVLVSAPILHGAVFGLFGAYRVLGVPDGFDVYEEMLRVVARPPWLFRVRLGHTLLLGEKGSIRVGPVVEMVHNPARNGSVFRAGIVATVVLTHHLEVLATFIPTIASPDRIGLAGGDFGQLGLRFRWGTPHGHHEPPLGPQQ